MDVKTLRAAGVLESKPPVQRFRGMRAIVFFPFAGEVSRNKNSLFHAARHRLASSIIQRSRVHLHSRSPAVVFQGTVYKYGFPCNEPFPF